MGFKTKYVSDVTIQSCLSQFSHEDPDFQPGQEHLTDTYINQSQFTLFFHAV